MRSATKPVSSPASNVRTMMARQAASLAINARYKSPKSLERSASAYASSIAVATASLAVDAGRAQYRECFSSRLRKKAPVWAWSDGLCRLS